MTVWRLQRAFYIQRIKHTRAFIQREKRGTRHFVAGETKRAVYIPVSACEDCIVSGVMLLF